ncbi:autotransporter outer membrane beta-barrel domain-containing protein [Pandoraea sp. ISTKB]|uniref:autotransporter outer membrane beta-barrel domain-containing protein n=1 Tax=Pandoraea sp. ISTKB TaxID=1586708 RepID=UPI001481235E|nr:autotransporter outer membrane beta-barrel domain-containing protein [Pandoraea sp. ISTKB]
MTTAGELPAKVSLRAISFAVAVALGSLGVPASAAELDNEHVVLEGDYGDEGWYLRNGSSLTIKPGGTGNPAYIHLGRTSNAMADIDGVRMVGNTNVVTPDGQGLFYMGVSSQASVRNSYIHALDTFAVMIGGQHHASVEGTPPIFHLENSTVIGRGRAMLIREDADVTIHGSTIIGEHDGREDNWRTNHAIQLQNATARISDSSIKGGLHGFAMISESRIDEAHSRLILSNTRVEGERGAAIWIDDVEQRIPLKASILIANGSELHGGNGKLIEAGYRSIGDEPFEVDVEVNNSQLTGDFDFNDYVDSDVTITNHGSLTGRLIGTDKLTLSDSGAWNLVEDSRIADLTMSGGIVDIHGTAAEGTWHTFDVDKLSGEGGTFAMQADLVIGAADKLNVNDTEASGNHKLLVKNTGTEGGVETQLLVDQAGGDATFSLVGDKVDAGVYTYELKSSGEAGGEQSWYLERSGEVSSGTDTVLGIHNALPTAWLGEHAVLRSRLGEARLGEGDNGGAWARTFGSRFHARPALGQGYSQDQWGVIAGSDAVVMRGDHGHWLIGGMLGTSTSRLDFNSGSTGTIESHTAGAYATWMGKNGYYFDGVLKYNRFASELDVRMRDGVRSKGDFVTHGVGLSAELGRTIALQNQWFVEPFAQVAGMWAGGSEFTLDNGMHARSNRTVSVLGTLGVNVGKTFETSKGTFQPYMKLAVTHEFANGNTVTANDISLKNDISGTRFEAGLGLAAQMTKNLQAYADASYSVGKRLDKPWGVNVGVRYRF